MKKIKTYKLFESENYNDLMNKYLDTNYDETMLDYLSFIYQEFTDLYDLPMTSADEIETDNLPEDQQNFIDSFQEFWYSVTGLEYNINQDKQLENRLKNRKRDKQAKKFKI